MGEVSNRKIIKCEASDRAVNIIMIIICGLLFFASIFLFAGSLVSTTTINLGEQVDFVWDNASKNIFVIAVFFVLLKCFKRFFVKINPTIAAVVLLTYVGILGGLWISLADLTPMADSKVIYETASKAIHSDYTPLEDIYFQISPYQLGGVFISEIFIRLFGVGNYMAFAILNIIWLDVAYIALIGITRVIFNKKGIELLTIFLLAGCLQPIFFCTLMYGNLMGLALSMWAVLFELLYLKTGKKHLMLIAAALISLAMLAKVNCAIVLIAMCVVLVLYFIKKRQGFSLVAIVCAVAMALAASGLVQFSYEARSGLRFGKGVPQLAWAVMGMQDNKREMDGQLDIEENLDLFPGWYNSYNIGVFVENAGNREAMEGQVNRDLKERLDVFLSEPEYAVAFFSNKTLSQWNEPTFESLWVSERNGAEPSELSDNFYKGLYNELLDIYFNFYICIVYFGLAAAMFFALKKSDLNFIFLALIILGGFTYHLIFEAKSQYVLTYFIMMIPFASSGFYSLVHLKLHPFDPNGKRPKLCGRKEPLS